MINILNAIISESGYSTIQTNGITYHSNGDKAYYFVMDISMDEIKAIKNYSDFTSNEKYIAFINAYNELMSSGSSVTIEKNSSLILLVKCNDLNVLADCQQQVLLLEEDEYFFKKYVILYSDAAIVEIPTDSVLSFLQEKVNQEDKFNMYANEGYKSELAQYLVILQLFIKLPFLKFLFDTTNYRALNQKISENLGENLNGLLNSYLENSEAFEQIDFTSPENEEKISELINLLPND